MNYISLFKESVYRNHICPAIVDRGGKRSTSYAALDLLSAQVAGKLKALGCGRNRFVMINMDRRMEYIAAYLGILKAGCAVVPVVPEYPEERVEYIKDNCSAFTVITDDFFDGIDAYTPFCEPAEDTEPALLIYTSGSTGNPKGILHSAADLARHAMRQTALFEKCERINYAAAALFSFVAHIFEYLTVLMLGGTSHILPDTVRKSLTDLEDYYDEHNISAGWIVTRILQLFRSRNSALKAVIVGSERVSNVYYPDFDIYNLYGMSEMGAITTKFVIDRKYENTPVGKALPPLENFIADEDGNPVSDGVEGEICIRGRYDMTYFRDPERTKRIFVRQPDGTTVFHTSDIGYVNENGDIVYVNRRDWMVKINGQRVETLEIETLLSKTDGIKEAAVKAFDDEDGQTYLVAYYVLSHELGEAEIREKLEKKLPPYMIPRFFVKMDALPKNLNSKLDRKNLLPPSAEQYKAKYTAPETDSEKAICAAFEAVLHCGRVGADDDFVALGGDSIKVLRLIEAAGIDGLTPDTVLRGKTPRGIGALVSETALPKIAHSDEIKAEYPLTESQRGVYLECVEAPESVMYNIPVLCRLPDGTDEERITKAVKAAAGRHPALFTVFSSESGTPSMIYRGGEAEVTVTDAASLEAECKSFVRPFDLENGPLYRFELVRHPRGLALLFDIHHIVFDGTSVEVLVSEIAAAYDGAVIESEPLTLFDIAESEKTLRDTDGYRAAEKFFEKLDGVECDSKPVSDVLTDDGQHGAGRLIIGAAEKFGEDAVLRYTKAHKITENTLFLGAFAYALTKFSGTKDASFCTASNGRHDHRLSSSVGMFVKSLPVHCPIDENSTVSDFLAGVQDDLFATLSHDCISFGDLAAKYGVSIDITFIYQGVMFDGASLSDGKMTVDMIDTGESQTDFDFMMIKKDGAYELMAHYKSAVYSEELVRSFAKMYMNVVASMLNAERLCDIRLTDDEAEEQIKRINRTEAEWRSSETIVSLFRAQAQKTPESTALVYTDRKFTYRELDSLTDRLAKYLVTCGVGREKVVGVLIPRCEYMLIASLGILKAGGAYLPLDPTYPPERLNMMVADSGAVMLITTPELDPVITSGFTGRRMMTDGIASLPDTNTVLPEPKPDDLFNMIYTSGSTGLPKGVMFEHSNALVSVEWVKKFYSMDETTRATSYASYGFDANIFDMYPPLISGGQLHIISEDIRLDFVALRRYFNENGITNAVMTTQVGRQFALMGGLNTLRALSVAGEKLTPLDPPEGFVLYNLYGPTEGSIVTSGFEVDRKYKDIPIGRAVDNLKLYVVDPLGRLLPCGATGELWISGPHVTRGYLNRPEKNAEAYGENRFCDDVGYERVYRTGDIVRLLSDGNIQFIGRRDAQVKVRGFRIELTEVEEVIRRYEGIKDATVAAFDEPSGGKYIAAYVVSDSPVDIDALNGFIRSEKPPYMVPAVTMQIDKIPLNQNQKVNRKALPVPERKAADITPPENETQKKIFDILAEVVGHTSFGIDTDVYDAGLMSIGALKLNVLLDEEFGVAVKSKDIRENSTVRKLEAFIASSGTADEYPVLADYPITKTQSGIFVECMSAPGSTVYNIPALLKIGDGIDTERLAEAVRTAIDAHPYVKTHLFADINGDIRAERRDSAPAKAEVKRNPLPDGSALIRPFELLGGDLYRVEIYDTGNGKYLFMDFHHIISDGTSEKILLGDIEKAYCGIAPDTEKYSGYEAALDEEKMRAGKAFGDAREYYTKLFGGCDTESLPQKTPESDEACTGSVKITAGPSADKVAAFCEKNRITPNAFFNGVFSYVLGKFTNKDELTYTTVYNGRSDSRLARSVTMLVKTIPIIARPDGKKLIGEYLDGMQDQLMNSMANDIYSFAEISAAHGVKADIIFIYQGDDFTIDTLCGEKAELITLLSDTAKSPLAINVFVKNGGYEIEVEYMKNIYSAAFAESLIDSIGKASVEFTEKASLGDVSLISEKAEVCYGAMNDTDLAIERIPVHEMFERQAALRPDETAVYAAGESLTFRELNEKANVLAHALKALGVGRETIVGVVLERTVEVLAAELGVLKAGGAFLPMLPTYPDDRISYCLSDSESPVVITTEKIKAEKPGLFGDGKTYRVATTEELLSGDGKDNLSEPTDPSQLAYCIYTSGSTGTPKGVMIEHRNFTNFVAGWSARIGYSAVSDGASCIATSSISFDMSLAELYPPICSGKCVSICTEDEFHNPSKLKELMLSQNVQLMIATPSVVNNLVSIPDFTPAIRNLKVLMLGAEAFPSSLYGALRAINPDTVLLNGYGPTETTICCSMKTVLNSRRITIGRPNPNYRYYVVDKAGAILPPYAAGELIICGDGVGRGYVKLPDKTAASFYTLNGIPAYHSGDLVRLTSDGEIDFCGRIDNQVKLRGFRVELDEIEKVMISFDSVMQSKVIVRNNGSEDYLVGFFTASAEVDIGALTEHMKSKLTYYMVPAVLMQLDAMPLTASGKIDKSKLPEVKKAARKEKKRSPRKSLEERLCEIFKSVLSLDECYADDDFFELGGTSLSASKVTMRLMADGITVEYGDIFDHPTPEELADFIESKNSPAAQGEKSTDDIVGEPVKALAYNKVEYAPEVVSEPLGTVLLTGAVGFLGIHVLAELMKAGTERIYCLIRSGSQGEPMTRLRTLLMYYFGAMSEDRLEKCVSVIDADITDPSLAEKLAGFSFDTVINCAACVKHFASDDILERINVSGVENLISVCMARGTKLIQISTTSIPGIHTDETFKKGIKMHENEFFMVTNFGDNKYVMSKYHAEERMYEAIEKGLRGKVIRVGNLMGRHSDGEFQVNFDTNMFLSGIRGFAAMGMYPISHMTDPMSFSPIDCTARAVILLASTNDKFTAFNADNRYGFDEMKLIDSCNRCGLTIVPTDDKIYYEEYKKNLGDPKLNSYLNGLAAYDRPDLHVVNTDNEFTTNILYRLGFSWPLVDDTYLDRVIGSLITLDYFNIEEEDY